jgi:hypothetical protein
VSSLQGRSHDSKKPHGFRKTTLVQYGREKEGLLRLKAYIGKSGTYGEDNKL